MFEYIGNIHIHSNFSDGAKTVTEIARIAASLDLDFIMIHDHDYSTESLHLEKEGFYGKCLVLMGLEVGNRHHHYLACDLNQMIKAGNSDPQEVIDRVNAQDGFGFMAHPFEKGMPFEENSRAYTWNDLKVSGFTGICIWNFASRWKERIVTVFHGLFFLAFKSVLLKGPSRKTLAFWDRSCQTRKVVAVGGSDAHGVIFKYGLFHLNPLPYDYLLNTINIHVMLEGHPPKDAANAKKIIYNAMKQGRLFIAHERLCPASGFRFHYTGENGIRIDMGEEMDFQPGTIFIQAPEHGRIRLIKDGSLLKTWHGEKVALPIKSKGVYRVEVYLRKFPFGWRPWIFSNPVYLR